MNVSKEFLLEAVGLSLLVALLLVGIQLFQRTSSLVSHMDREQEQQLEQLAEHEITQYDGLVIDGITAISHIKNVVGNYQIPVYVETMQNSFVVEKREEYVSLRDAESEHFISSFELYRCEVIRNENGSIERVEIKIQREGE